MEPVSEFFQPARAGYSNIIKEVEDVPRVNYTPEAKNTNMGGARGQPLDDTT